MYIRKITRKKDGKTTIYRALVESRRTSRGPRRHVVASLGELNSGGPLGLKMAAEGRTHSQPELFKGEWAEVNIRAVRT